MTDSGRSCMSCHGRAFLSHKAVEPFCVSGSVVEVLKKRCQLRTGLRLIQKANTQGLHIRLIQNTNTQGLHIRLIQKTNTQGLHIRLIQKTNTQGLHIRLIQKTGTYTGEWVLSIEHTNSRWATNNNNNNSNNCSSTKQQQKYESCESGPKSVELYVFKPLLSPSLDRCNAITTVLSSLAELACP